MGVPRLRRARPARAVPAALAGSPGRGRPRHRGVVAARPGRRTVSSVTGSIPAGLPSFDPSATSPGPSWLSLALPAVAIFLVELLRLDPDRSIVRRPARRDVDADQELLAFGAASVAAGFSQGMPIGTSGSRTAVNDSMKATSQVSGLVGFGAIARHPAVPHRARSSTCPTAVLGRGDRVRVAEAHRPRAVAGAGPQQPRRGRHRRDHVPGRHRHRRAAGHRGRRRAVHHRRRPPSRHPDRRRAGLLRSRADRYADVGTHPDAGVTPGVVVYRIQERLFFANAHFFKRRVWAAVDGAPKPVRPPRPRRGDDQRHRRQRGRRRSARSTPGCAAATSTFEVARATDELREQFERDRPRPTLIGAEHFHATVTAAVEACADRRES